MADDFDFSEEADAQDLQSFHDSQAAARAEDDQARFAETSQAAQEQQQKPEGETGNATKAVGGKTPVESPLGKFGTVVKGAADWVKKLPANLSLGALDAAVNTASLPFDMIESMSEFSEQAERDMRESGEPDTLNFYGSNKTPEERRNNMPHLADLTPFQRQLWDETERDRDEEAAGNRPISSAVHELPQQVSAAYRAWRGELSEESSTSDALTQGAAQFMVPFTAFSKAFGVSSKLGFFQNMLRGAAAEVATSATVLGAHDGRAADLIQLGLGAENKFGDLMRTLMPDGTLANQYIEWVSDRDGEGAMMGRFKNTLDGLGISAALGSVLKTAGLTFKAARKSLRAVGDVADYGSIHMDWKKSAVEPAGTGARETHTGLVFEDPKDAQSTVEELAHQYGPGFEQRQTAARNAASDKNFATLHSFASVLKSQIDKPVKTHSLIEALEKNLKGDTETGAFYKELLGRLKAKNLGGTTTVTSEGRGGNRGTFVIDANAVKLHPNAFIAGPEKLLHTFTHEAVHAATVREIRESPEVAAKINRLHRKVTSAFQQARNGVSAESTKTVLNVTTPQDARKGVKTYGFTDPEEFVAEIESNPQFRQLMKDTTVDGKSAWDKYLEAIAGILGIAGIATNPEFSKLMDPKELEDESA